MRVKSHSTEIFYTVIGSGPDVVLLHPFPASHKIWMPVAERLSDRYRIILPDLRGMGESAPGASVITMEKHADDVAAVCKDAAVGRAVFAGSSIGGYILYEYWRRYREQFRALALCNTKASADSAEAKSARLKSANEVEEQGTEQFLQLLMPKLLGATTLQNRPDIVEKARTYMNASAEGVAGVQRGMAERKDSTSLLPMINVLTLIIGGEEEGPEMMSEWERMKSNISGSELRIISRAGHYAVFEKAEEAADLMRTFLDRLN